MSLITITTPSGFKLYPKPALLRPRREVRKPIRKVSPADIKYSLDERTSLILDEVTQEANQLADSETRDLWLDAVRAFRDTGNIDELINLTKWRRAVVPLDEFLYSEAYLGLEKSELYPAVIDLMHELDKDIYTEAVLKGALGYGKTTSANIMMARGLYKVSCMRHPQSTFGLQSQSAIAFTIQSIRLSTAKKAVFEEFGQYVRKSPYFKEIYPYNRMIVSSMNFEEQRVTIIPVSSATTGAISMNVIGGTLDELNFMQRVLKSKSQNAEIDGSYSQARALYNTLARRRKSRFAKKGKLPGLLFLISSSRFPDDFTEQKAAEAQMCGGTDPTIFVVSKSVWEAKGRENFMPESFKIMVGNNMLRSRILEGDDLPIEGTSVIEVPMDFKVEFEKDLEGALRDFAGITVLSAHPFLTKRSAIFKCVQQGAEHGMENPFEYEQYDFSLGIPHPDPKKLRTDIPMFRHAHIDLGLKRDAAGICIGHLAGQKLIERFDPVANTKVTEMKPIIATDIIIRVVPPPNGEIEFALIREFLLLLRDRYNLPIEYVTFDGFQSVDSKQILRTKGFKCDHLSVEKIENYRSFRDALYDGCMYLLPHQFLANELAGLEYVRGNNSTQQDKVDHRVNGTKDVADAVCGVTAFLLKRRIGWSPSFNKFAGINENVQEPAQQEAQLQEGTAQAVRGMTLRKSVFRRPTNRKAVVRR